MTQHVRLVTSVLLAPLRNAVLLAKQAASVDALSGGRLTLGLGAGLRDDDFQVAGVDFRTRGRRKESGAPERRVHRRRNGSGPKRKLYDMADESWRQAGRPGKPRFVCTSRSAPMPTRASAPTSATITRSWVPRSAT